MRLFIAAFLAGMAMSSLAQSQDTTSYTVLSDTAVEVSTKTEAGDSNSHTLIAPDSLELTKRYRTQPLKTHPFDNIRWKKAVGETNYDEQEIKKTTPLNWSAWSNPILRIISYAIIIVLCLVMIYFLLKGLSGTTPLKKTVTEMAEYHTTPEDIMDVDLAAMLKRALSEGNLKLAVRLYYLALLKSLDQAGAIVWKKDKTNREYLNEVSSRGDLISDVRTLTMAYEQIWYGDHGVTADRFEWLKIRFENIEGRINQSAG